MDYHRQFWNTVILITFRAVILEALPADIFAPPQLRQHHNLEYGICNRPLAVSICMESCMADNPREFGNMALFASNLVKYLSNVQPKTTKMAINYCSSVQQWVEWTSSTDVFAAYVMRMTQLYSYNLNRAFGPFGPFSNYGMYSPLQPSAGVCLDKVRMAMAQIPPNYQPLTVIFTSGRSSNPATTIQQAQAIMLAGAEIFVVTEETGGVTEELRLSVSGPSYLLTIDGMSFLGKAELDQVIKRVCKIEGRPKSRTIHVNVVGDFGEDVPPILPQISDELSTTPSTLNFTEAPENSTTTVDWFNSTINSSLSDTTSQPQNGNGSNNSELGNSTTVFREITTTEITPTETTLSSDTISNTSFQTTTDAFGTFTTNSTPSEEMSTEPASNRTLFDENNTFGGTNSSSSLLDAGTNATASPDTNRDSNTTLFNAAPAVTLQSDNEPPNINLNVLQDSASLSGTFLVRNATGKNSEFNVVISGSTIEPPQNRTKRTRQISSRDDTDNCVDVNKISDPILRANILRDKKACVDSAAPPASLNAASPDGTPTQPCLDLSNITNPLERLDIIMANIPIQPCTDSAPATTPDPQISPHIILNDTDIESLTNITQSMSSSRICIDLNNVIDVYKLGILLSNWPGQTLDQAATIKPKSDSSEKQVIDDLYQRYSTTNKPKPNMLSTTLTNSSKIGPELVTPTSTSKTPSILGPHSGKHFHKSEIKALNETCMDITQTPSHLRQIVSLLLQPCKVCTNQESIDPAYSGSNMLSSTRGATGQVSCYNLRPNEEPILSIGNKFRNPWYVCVDQFYNSVTSLREVISMVKATIVSSTCIDLTTYPSQFQPIILIVSFPVPACSIPTLQISGSTTPPPSLSGKECIDLSPYNETISQVVTAVSSLRSCQKNSASVPVTTNRPQASVYAFSNSSSFPPYSTRRCLNDSEIPSFLETFAAKLVSLYPGFICKTRNNSIQTSPTIDGIPAPSQETTVTSHSQTNKGQGEATAPPCVDINGFSSREIPVVIEFIKPLTPCPLINENQEAASSTTNFYGRRHPSTTPDSSKPCLDLNIFPAFVRPIVRLFPVLNSCPKTRQTHLSKRDVPAAELTTISSLLVDPDTYFFENSNKPKQRKKRTAEKAAKIIIKASERVPCVDISILEESEIPFATAFLLLYNISTCPYNVSTLHSSNQLKLSATCVNITSFTGKEKSAITAFFSIYGIPPCSETRNCLGVSLLPDALASKYVEMFGPNIMCNIPAQTRDIAPTTASVATVADEMCHGATVVNDVSLKPAPGRCHAFVVCSQSNSDGNWTQHDIIPCPPQLFWSQEKLTCVRPEDSECMKDQCNQTTSAAKMPSVVFPACAEYLLCNNGSITRACCPEQQVLLDGECQDGVNIGCPHSCVSDS